MAWGCGGATWDGAVHGGGKAQDAARQGSYPGSGMGTRIKEIGESMVMGEPLGFLLFREYGNFRIQHNISELPKIISGFQNSFPRKRSGFGDRVRVIWVILVFGSGIGKYAQPDLLT